MTHAAEALPDDPERGGTRLKIVEAMAMGKAIVSTTLGAEGIEAIPGRDLSSKTNQRHSRTR
jgi:hypothetical protein